MGRKTGRLKPRAAAFILARWRRRSRRQLRRVSQREQIVDDRGPQKMAQGVRINFTEAGFRGQTSKRAGACVAERVDCGMEVIAGEFLYSVGVVEAALAREGLLTFQPIRPGGRLLVRLRVGALPSKPLLFNNAVRGDGVAEPVVSALHFSGEAEQLGVVRFGKSWNRCDGGGDRHGDGAGQNCAAGCACSNCFISLMCMVTRQGRSRAESCYGKCGTSDGSPVGCSSPGASLVTARRGASACAKAGAIMRAAHAEDKADAWYPWGGHRRSVDIRRRPKSPARCSLHEWRVGALKRLAGANWLAHD